MSAVLKARLVKIGNSHGIRIPKVWLDQLEMRSEVELAMQANQIIIRPAYRPRHDWARWFQAMALNGDDLLLDDLALSTQWDKDEWEW